MLYEVITHDLTGNYAASFVVSALFFAFAAGLMPLLGRYPNFTAKGCPTGMESR